MMMSEGKVIAMELMMTPAAGMNECGVTKASTHMAATKSTAVSATHVAAHMAAAKSTAVSAATGAVSAAMGQRRHRRTGCKDRRHGQRYRHLAHRDVSLRLLRPTPGS